MPVFPALREPRRALLPLRPRALEHLCRRVELRLLRVERCLAVVQLRFRLRQAFVGCRLLPVQLRPARFVGRLPVGELLLAFLEGGRGVVQLRLRVGQLRVGVGLPALVVGARVVQLCLGIGTQAVRARLLARRRQGLDGLLGGIDAGVVGFARCLLRRSARHGQKRLGVGKVVREVAFGHVEDLLDGPAAQRGGAQAGRGGVVRRSHQAHHAVSARRQHVVHVQRSLAERHHVAHLHRRAHDHVAQDHAFTQGARAAPLQKHGSVQDRLVLRHGVHAVARIARQRRLGQRVDAHGKLLALDGGHSVGFVGSHHALDAVRGAQRLQIIVGEPQGGKHAHVQ